MIVSIVILYGNQGWYGNGPGGLVAISNRVGITCWSNAGSETGNGGDARRVDDSTTTSIFIRRSGSIGGGYEERGRNGGES
jgi:hypothetical protein